MVHVLPICDIRPSLYQVLENTNNGRDAFAPLQTLTDKAGLICTEEAILVCKVGTECPFASFTEG